MNGPDPDHVRHVESRGLKETEAAGETRAPRPPSGRPGAFALALPADAVRLRHRPPPLSIFLDRVVLSLWPPRMTESCYLGIDLGGTQLRMAGVAADGHLLTEMLSSPTGRDFGPAEFRAQVPELVARVKAQLGPRSLAGLGLGTAGVVRPGPLSQCSNLPRLNGLDLAEALRSTTALPVTVENDARCFTFAEARYGAARGARHVVGITLGTGVGRRGDGGRASPPRCLLRGGRGLGHPPSGEAARGIPVRRGPSSEPIARPVAIPPRSPRPSSPKERGQERWRRAPLGKV